MAKSILMLIPFVLLIVGLKMQGHRMKEIMRENSPEPHRGDHHNKHHGEGRHLQSRRPFSPMGGPPPMWSHDMPPSPDAPQDFESHTHYTFRSNHNGQEVSLNMEDPSP